MLKNFLQHKRGTKKTLQKNQRGFLLVELIVSVFIFGIVMSISVGALVMALDANKKTQSLKSVLNNLNVVLDTMTKSLSTGRYYYCDDRIFEDMPHQTRQDCAGEHQIMFLAGEDLGDDLRELNGLADDGVKYEFIPPTTVMGSPVNGYIQRVQLHNGTMSQREQIRLTAPEVNITDMRFYVTGAETPGDNEQPKVLIVIDGEALSGPRGAPTTFTVQTLVTQLTPDF
jgi:type II secretory pathway pseudopilin PulG